MLRTAGGVIVGYVVMFFVVFVLFTIAYLSMGTERAFRPGSFDVSALWLGTSIVVGFAAALVGGLISVKVGGTQAGMILAGLVLVLGIVMAFPTLNEAEKNTGERSGDHSNFEAMEQANQPSWIAFLNPVIGAVGVWVGAKRRG